jgi:hypothetical protein
MPYSGSLESMFRTEGALEMVAVTTNTAVSPDDSMEAPLVSPLGSSPRGNLKPESTIRVSDDMHG